MGVKNIFSTLFKSEDAPRESGKFPASAVAPKQAVASPSPSPARRAAAPKGDPTMLKSRWQTEKAVNGEKMGQYAFVVGVDVNKAVVRDSFWALTGVRPVRVTMHWVYPKRSARGVTRRRQKKAIITVAKGTTVNFPSEMSKTRKAGKTSKASSQA